MLSKPWFLGKPLNPYPYFGLLSFSYQAQSWNKPRRVVAKVEWHPDELYPRVGFIIINLARPAARVVAFYNQRGTAEPWIKEGKVRSNRRGCPAAPLPLTPFASSFTSSRITLGISCGCWRCPRQPSRGH